MTVINSSVAKITFVVAELTFKVIVITSLVVKITFVVAEVAFKVVVINSSVCIFVVVFTNKNVGNCSNGVVHFVFNRNKILIIHVLLA